MRLSKLVVAGLSIVLVMGLSSCGSKQKTYTNADGTVTVDQNGGNITFRGKDGNGGTISVSGTTGAKLPKDFPADIPIYPGAKILTAMSIGGAGHSAALETGDGPDKIIAFYSKTFEKDGWSKVGEMHMTDMQNVSFEKEERTVTVSAINNKTRSGTGITLTIANDS